MKKRFILRKRLGYAILFVLGTGLGSLPVYAQSNPNADVPSPQAWSFMRYGNTPVNYYTGTVTAEIPLYSYRDRDFDFPLSLKYASNGLLPNKPAGTYGNDWFLNAGGMISRTVKGLPDDMDTEMFIDNNVFSVNLKGFYYYHHKKVSEDFGSRLIDRVPSGGFFPFFCIYYSLNGDYYDTEPDVFHFNFGGYSGSFQLGANGEVYVYNTNAGKGVIRIEKIQLGGLNNSYIVMRTGDGYTYTFGGDRSNIEYSYVENLHYYDRHETVTSWYLSEIKAPNGRKIVLNYENDVPEMRLCSPVVENVKMRWSGRNGSGFQDYGPVEPKYVCIKPALLSSIDIDGKVSIGFRYEEKEEEKTENNMKLSRDKKLASLSVTEQLSGKKGMLRYCDFYYCYPSSGNPRLFLEKVHVSGEGDYRMEYYYLDRFCPWTGTFAIDHWGYYNRVGNREIPAVLNLSNYAETINGTSRNPSGEESKYGMLRKLVYPTQGYTLFEYEPHDYSRKVVRELPTAFRPALVNCDLAEAGGVRIRKITDYPAGEGEGITRELTYRISPTMSSGILLHFPRYCMYCYIDKGIGYTECYQQSLCFNYNALDNTPIGYRNVCEKRGDGSAIEYVYSDYGLIPDQIGDTEVHQLFNQSSEVWRITNHFDYYMNLTMEPVSMHNQRGKLIAKKMTDTRGKLLHKEEYVYGRKPLACQKSVKVTGHIYYTVHTPVEDYTLDKLVKTDYYGPDSVVQETSRQYNTLGQLIATETINSDGLRQREEALYIPDIPSASRTEAENKLLADNRIDIPVETKTKVRRGDGAEQLSSRIRTLFGSFGNLILPSEIRVADIRQPDAENKQLTYTAYDNYGNPLEYRTAEGLITVCIWGYRGLYLVACIENTTLEKVKTIAGLSGIGTTPLPGGLNEVQEQALRQITEAQVTTWEYRPFVGLISETGPDGKKAGYEYDAYGRLIRVEDGEGHVKEMYWYHVKK